MLRYALARVRNQGYGLGNELVPWARAFLAAQVLGAKLLPPAFGLNRRGYWRDFHGSPDDWIYNRAIERLLPVVEFTEADWHAHGGDDVVAAIRSFAAAHRLHERFAYVFVTHGLWGGYHHVQAARDFMRSTLYQSRYAAANLLRLRERIDPDRILVGLHVRLGDFKPAGDARAYRITASMSLPLQWFLDVASCLRRTLGDVLQFLLVSDGTREQLQPLIDSLPCITTADLPHTDCSDALALADSDLLVCSASTYSYLAAFLSDSPYLCFAPNLYRHPEGCYSVGDPTADLARPSSARMRAVRDFTERDLTERDLTGRRASWLARGIPVDFDGNVPASLIECVRARHAWRRWQSDLARGGVAPG